MKTIGYAIALIILSLFAIGMVGNDFIGNENTLNYFILGGLVFSIAPLFIIHKEGLIKKLIELVQINYCSPRLLAIGMVILVPTLTVTASCIGLPKLLNFFLGTQGETVVTVDFKGIRYSSIGDDCLGKVYLQDYIGHICGVKKNNWDRLQVGSKLTLTGKKSVFGIKYDPL